MIAITDALARAILDAGYDQAFGDDARIEIRTGPPTDSPTVPAGSALWRFTLPENPIQAGQSTREWSGPATGTGDAGHYRIGSGDRWQTGTVTGPDGDGDMMIQNVSIVAGQTVTVKTFGVALEAAA